MKPNRRRYMGDPTALRQPAPPLSVPAGAGSPITVPEFDDHERAGADLDEVVAATPVSPNPWPTPAQPKPTQNPWGPKPDGGPNPTPPSGPPKPIGAAIQPLHSARSAFAGLLVALPLAAMQSRLAQPHGAEAALLGLHAKLGEVRAVLPSVLPVTDGQTRAALSQLAALLG